MNMALTLPRSRFSHLTRQPGVLGVIDNCAWCLARAQGKISENELVFFTPQSGGVHSSKEAPPLPPAEAEVRSAFRCSDKETEFGCVSLQPTAGSVNSLLRKPLPVSTGGSTACLGQCGHSAKYEGGLETTTNHLLPELTSRFEA